MSGNRPPYLMFPLFLAEKIEDAVEAARTLTDGCGRLPELARFVRDRRS